MYFSYSGHVHGMHLVEHITFEHFDAAHQSVEPIEAVLNHYIPDNGSEGEVVLTASQIVLDTHKQLTHTNQEP